MGSASSTGQRQSSAVPAGNGFSSPSSYPPQRTNANGGAVPAYSNRIPEPDGGTQSYPMQQQPSHVQFSNPPTSQVTGSYNDDTTRQAAGQEINWTEEYDFASDCSRDLVLSRVMAAEEFLGRMEETDVRIKNYASVTDRASVYTQLTEQLGLRGHLQDELLRIQAMLAEDDPNLQCLRDFEISHPKAVGKLRELGNNARALEALSKTRALAEFGGTTTADDISADMGVDPSLLRTIEERVEEVGIVAAHADGFNGEDVQMMRVSAGELKVKHDEIDPEYVFMAEERNISEQFAQRLVHSNNVMPDDVTRVLNDHAVSMQALRNRQNMERQKIQARGKATPSTATSGQIYTGSKVATTQNSPPVTDNVQIVQQTFVSQVQFKPGMKNVSPLTPINKASGLPPIKKVGTATIIQMTENPRPESGKKRNRNKGKKGPRPGSASSIKSNTLSGGVNSNTDLDALIAAATRSQTEASYSEDPDEEFGEDGEKDDLRSTLTEDLWEKRKKMTQEEFKSLLGNYRDQQDELSKVRTAEKDKHKAAMLAKMAGAKRGGQYDSKIGTGNDVTLTSSGAQTATSGVNAGTDVRLGHEDTTETFSTSNKDEMSSVDDHLDAQLEQNLAESDEKFLEKIRRNRRLVDGGDFDELLRRHLAEAEAIRRKHLAEKSRLNEKLRAKLGLTKSDYSDQDDEALIEELKQLDFDFRGKLKDKGSRSLQNVDSLLAEHRRRQQEIIRKRGAEKSRSAEMLREKLQEGRNVGRNDGFDTEVIQELKEKDEEFLERLQRDRRLVDGGNFDDLLKRHLADADAIRRKRLAEKSRLAEKLQSHLGQKTEGYEDDEELAEELSLLDVDLRASLKDKGSRSLQDVDSLLAEHRRRQQEIIRKRGTEKSRTAEILREKLREQKNGKQNVIQSADLDDEFFARLQRLQQTGQLTQAEFQDMMRDHLNKLDAVKTEEQMRERRRIRQMETERERDAAEAARTASSLVEEHQEKEKHRRNLRQRERQALHEKLNAKLANTTRQKQVTPEADDDVYSF